MIYKTAEYYLKQLGTVVLRKLYSHRSKFYFSCGLFQIQTLSVGDYFGSRNVFVGLIYSRKC